MRVWQVVGYQIFSWQKTYMLFVDLVICIHARTICLLEGVGWRTRKSGSDVSDLSIL